MTSPKTEELVSVEDYEKEAANIIPKDALNYFRGGAGDELTAALNREAFTKLRLRPRFLRDVTGRSINLTVLGKQLKSPIGISPTAFHKVVHHDGEIATAKAAGETGSVYIMSSLSNTTMEDVAIAAPDTHKWLQIYVCQDRSVTENFIRRAEKSGYEALILTIDSPRVGLRRSRLRNNFQLPSHLRHANFPENFAKPLMQLGKRSFKAVSTQFAFDVTWKDVDWLISSTSLPIILKGILTKEDALLAVHHRCAGILVSNHGGRQLDSVPASIEVLPEIVEAVGDKMLIMFDGGITQGTDILKALALGAQMVFVGRPIIWGLAVNGQKGIEEVLNILNRELELAMDLMGCVKLSELTNKIVIHESHYNKCKCKL